MANITGRRRRPLNLTSCLITKYSSKLCSTLSTEAEVVRVFVADKEGRRVGGPTRSTLHTIRPMESDTLDVSPVFSHGVGNVYAVDDTRVLGRLWTRIDRR